MLFKLQSNVKKAALEHYFSLGARAQGFFVENVEITCCVNYQYSIQIRLRSKKLDRFSGFRTRET